MPKDRFSRPSDLGPGGYPDSYQLRWNRVTRPKQLAEPSLKPSDIVSRLQNIKGSGVQMEDWEKILVDRILRYGVNGIAFWFHERAAAVEIIRRYRFASP